MTPPSSLPRRTLTLTIDGASVETPEGSTILDALRAHGIATPTLCWADNLTPVNVCRVCVVELEGARTLVPSCSRKAEAGMVVKTKSERVETSRRTVLELLASTVDTRAAESLLAFGESYGADPLRFGAQRAPEHHRDHAEAGHHHPTDGAWAESVEQPVKVDNELYVRDYAKCILCYKCVEACGMDAQATFAIAVAGRGFEARISTEHNVSLPESACVYCGNCIGVCPTGALMFTNEHNLRAEGHWQPEAQRVTDTVCPYCGVGCVLRLHVQDEAIVKVTSPTESTVTHGNLCIKGRFGFGHVVSLRRSKHGRKAVEAPPGR